MVHVRLREPRRRVHRELRRLERRPADGAARLVCDARRQQALHTGALSRGQQGRALLRATPGTVERA